MADLLLTGANGQVGWEIARQAAGLSLHAADRAALDIADAGAVAAAFARFSPKVVINEFVDVAKAFFPEGKESKFVNAVLDHMAREAKPEAF